MKKHRLPKQNTDGSYNIKTLRYGILGVPCEVYKVIKDYQEIIKKQNETLRLFRIERKLRERKSK